jgi:hypothetical protein
MASKEKGGQGVMAWDAGIHGGGAATVDVYTLYIVMNMYSAHVCRLVPQVTTLDELCKII